MADKRFKKIYTQGVMGTQEIWQDVETGVQYLYITAGYSGGLTPAAGDGRQARRHPGRARLTAGIAGTAKTRIPKGVPPGSAAPFSALPPACSLQAVSGAADGLCRRDPAA